MKYKVYIQAIRSGNIEFSETYNTITEATKMIEEMNGFLNLVYDGYKISIIAELEV